MGECGNFLLRLIVTTSTQVNGLEITASGWSENEKIAISNYHWWNMGELKNTIDIVFPTDIPAILLW